MVNDSEFIENLSEGFEEGEVWVIFIIIEGSFWLFCGCQAKLRCRLEELGDRDDGERGQDGRPKLK